MERELSQGTIEREYHHIRSAQRPWQGLRNFGGLIILVILLSFVVFSAYTSSSSWLFGEPDIIKESITYDTDGNISQSVVSREPKPPKTTWDWMVLILAPYIVII